MQCRMCKLINHKSALIHNNDLIVVSLNYEPLHEAHILVLPKRHVASLDKLTGKELKEIFNYINKLEQIIKRKYDLDVNIVMGRGKLGTQQHLHFHVLPSSIGLRGLYARALNVPFREKLSDQKLEKIRDKIKDNLCE